MESLEEEKMESLAEEISANKLKTNIILVATKLITPEDTNWDRNWRQISFEYKKCKDYGWLDKATVSLINSIYTQKRMAFCLSRESLRELLNSDKNWEKPIGLRDSYYRKFLDHVFRGGLLENEPSDKVGRKLMVLKIKHPKLLSMFNFDMDAQLSETREFAWYKNTRLESQKSKKEPDSHSKPKEKIFKVTSKSPKGVEDSFELLKDKEQVVIEKVYAKRYRTKEWFSLMDEKKYKEAKILEREVLDNFAFEYLKMNETDKLKFIAEESK